MTRSGKLHLHSSFSLKQVSLQVHISLWNLEENFSLKKTLFSTFGRRALEYILSKKDKESKNNYKHRLSISDKEKEVYDEVSKEYIMTPRLLHSVLEGMYTKTNGKVEEAFAQYTKMKQHKILNFRTSENIEYTKFQLHIPNNPKKS